MVETYRPPREDDYDGMWALATRWDVVRQLGGWRWPPDPAQIRLRCQPYAGDGFVWAICRDDRLIGTVGVIRGDLGYTLHPDHHRQGIMRRACRVAIDQAVSDGATRITAATWADNDASHALLLGLGFTHWQTHYQKALARGVPTLSRRYRLDVSGNGALERGQERA